MDSQLSEVIRLQLVQNRNFLRAVAHLKKISDSLRGGLFGKEPGIVYLKDVSESLSKGLFQKSPEIAYLSRTNLKLDKFSLGTVLDPVKVIVENFPVPVPVLDQGHPL